MPDLLLVAFSLLIVWLAWQLTLIGHRYIKLDPAVERNALHLLAGCWGLLWLLFSSRWIAFGVSLGATAGLLLAFLTRKRWRWIERATEGFGWENGEAVGIVLYGFTLAMITLLLWDRPAVGTATIFALALGDGLADAVGHRWGRTQYNLPWSQGRSLEGSLACFLATAAAIYLGYALLGASLAWPLVLAGGLIGALAEGLSPPHLDNIVMPAACAIFLLLVA